MYYNRKFSQKNRLQINRSKDSTNPLRRKTTTNNLEIANFTKLHKKRTS